MRQHREDFVSERWSKFSWFGIRKVLNTNLLGAEKEAAHPNVSDVLNHIEAILIAAAEPVHNRQGGRFGDKVDQYLQYRDAENVGPDLTQMVRELWANSK